MIDYMVKVSFLTVVSGQEGLEEEQLIENALPEIKDNILAKMGNGELRENIDWIRPDDESINDIWY